MTAIRTSAHNLSPDPVVIRVRVFDDTAMTAGELVIVNNATLNPAASKTKTVDPGVDKLAVQIQVDGNGQSATSGTGLGIRRIRVVINESGQAELTALDADNNVL